MRSGSFTAAFLGGRDNACPILSCQGRRRGRPLIILSVRMQ